MYKTILLCRIFILVLLECLAVDTVCTGIQDIYNVYNKFISIYDIFFPHAINDKCTKHITILYLPRLNISFWTKTLGNHSYNMVFNIYISIPTDLLRYYRPKYYIFNGLKCYTSSVYTRSYLWNFSINVDIILQKCFSRFWLDYLKGETRFFI